MAILSLADAKTLLAVSSAADDALLGALLTAAESFVAEYCRRRFGGGPAADTLAGGGRYLFLSDYPAEGVAVAGVDPAAYRVHADRGVVEAVGGRFPPGELAVTYTVPAGQVPGGVKRACAELVAHWYKQTKTHAAAGYLNVGTGLDAAGNPTAYAWGQSTGFKIPAGVLATLGLFKVPGL